MPDNPYSTPQTDSTARVDSAEADQIRAIADGQRRLVYLAIAHVILFFMAAAEWKEPWRWVAIASVGLMLALLALTFLVSLLVAPRVFVPAAAGWMISFATLLPCAGFMAVLIVSRRASSKLEELGIEVGYLGSDP